MSKESLPDNDDNGNEADSESEEDTPATFDCEPIVACFNNPQCNNPIGDDEEWKICGVFESELEYVTVDLCSWALPNIIGDW